MPHVPNAPADSSSSSGLGTQRQTSSIPMAEPASSSHQPGDSPVWVYPSEQMFFNAMKRKVGIPSCMLCVCPPACASDWL